MEKDRNSNSTITLFTDDDIALNPSRNPEETYFFASISSIKYILPKLPNKTSSGVDNVPTIVLKYLPHRVTEAYLVIFNNAINNKYFPKPWKTAKIFPIAKKGKDPSQPTSYRPISLTPTISKVFEIIISMNINQVNNTETNYP